MIGFFKYQAAGNDFIIFKETELSKKRIEKICDRHFGIGGDGILIHYNTDFADAGMKIFNKDSSLAQMCGNGLRCFVTYLVNDCKITKNPLIIETGKGNLNVKWRKTGKKIIVEANLNTPVLQKHELITYKDLQFDSFLISTGNPHLVLFPKKKISACEIKDTADFFLKNNSSANEVNVEIATDIDRRLKNIFVIVKERGAGYTLACGTGGAAVIYGLFKKEIVKQNDKWKVFFPGGEITYKINENNEIIMEGNSQKVFEGTFNITEF